MLGKLVGIEDQAQGEGAAPCEVLERGGQPVVEAAGPQAVGDLAQLGHGGGDLIDGGVDEAVELDRPACGDATLGDAQPHAEGHQTLLGAVVQVHLEASPLLVPGTQQPLSARLDLAQGVSQLAAQPGRLGDKSSFARHLLGNRCPARTSHDQADLVALEADRDTRSRNGVPRHVHEVGRTRPPVAHAQRRVAHGLAQHGLELFRFPGAVMDVGDQRLDGRDAPGAPRVQPPPRKRSSRARAGRSRTTTTTVASTAGAVESAPTARATADDTVAWPATTRNASTG